MDFLYNSAIFYEVYKHTRSKGKVRLEHILYESVVIPGVDVVGVVRISVPEHLVPLDVPVPARRVL